MATIDENWNIVDVTRAFCQKVLPLVYDESLSYMEMVCKMSSKLNEVIENNNNLPQYVKDLIKEIVDSDEFTQIVGSVLMDTIINVKFPPEGIVPAKGDGVTDDTKSIQDCLDYANAQGGAVVFFPSGKYLTGTLSINSKTSILGADRYNTTLFLKGGGNTPLLQGVIHQSIRNIALDGNRLNQIEENYLIDGDIENALLANVILEDSAHCITSEKCNGNEFCNVKVLDIGDSVFIDAIGNNNLLTNINTEYSIIITGENNNWQSAQQTKIDSVEPLEYQAPQKLNEYFNYVTMQKNGEEYKILVEGNELNNLNKVTENEWKYYGYLFAPYCPVSKMYPQGACMANGLFLLSYAESVNDTAIIQKINKEGIVVQTSDSLPIGHCNTLSYNSILKEIYCSRFYTTNTVLGSNIIYVLDYDTLTIKEVLQVGNKGIRSFIYYNNAYYVQTQDNEYYYYDRQTNSVTYLFTIDIAVNQNININDNKIYILAQNNCIYIYDLQGNYLNTISLDLNSADMSVVNVEFENIIFDENDIYLTDVGWKLTNTGRYNRHVILSVNKSILPTNESVRIDASNIMLYCSNEYHAFQNGSKLYPYDSLDYAGKIGTVVSTFIFFELQNESFNQYVKLSNIKCAFNSGELGSIYLDFNCKLSINNAMLTGSTVAQMALDNNIDECFIFMRQNCEITAVVLPGAIDCQNKDFLCFGLQCLPSNFIIANFKHAYVCLERNTFIPNLNHPVYYVLPANKVMNYRNLSNTEPYYLGSNYGAYSKTVNIRLNNLSVIEYDNVSVFSMPLVEFGVSGNVVICDPTVSTVRNSHAALLVENNVYNLFFRIKANNKTESAKANITFSNIKIYKNGEDVTETVAPTFVCDFIRIF